MNQQWERSKSCIGRIPTSMKQTPNWLDKLGKTYWKRITAVVQVDDTNADLVALLADQYSTYRQATDNIAKNGLTYESNLTWKPNPAVAIRKQALDNIRQLTKLVGQSAAPEARDKLDEIMGGR